MTCEREKERLPLCKVLLTSFPCSFICLMDFSCSGWRGSPPQRVLPSTPSYIYPIVLD